MTYSDKLKDPRWQKRRLEVMQRDGWQCVRCGSGLNDGIPFNVHHLRYHKEPWNARDEDLETLCEQCHERESFFVLFVLGKSTSNSRSQ